ncbi:MAG: retropepsin-like domain-containing protein [Anaerolineales bacterium]|nr:retropepsin-like domain-containing protein [Anaerolineales bacterium]
MLTYTHDYDTAYNPAMPIVDIALRRSANQPAIQLQAIVDTGSDATMIPITYLRQIKARKGHRQILSGTAGGRYEVDLYSVSVQIGSYRPIYVDAAGTTRGNEVIIGRDVLNQFVITLNAPAHVVEVVE